MTSGRQVIWLILALGAAGCSAIVNFDKPDDPVDTTLGEARDGGEARDSGEARDGSVIHDSGTPAPDGGGVIDATTGGRGDAQTDGHDASSGTDASLTCDPATHAGCGPSELCCDRGDGLGLMCRGTSVDQGCAACGQGCSDPAGPYCGMRHCECEPGSGQPCAAGTLCIGDASNARCVECESDDDCEGHAGGDECVAGRCRECSRGALANDAADDEGCDDPARPICSAQNTCVACSKSPDNCPGNQVCNGELGCIGCDLSRGLDPRNCGGTRPICRPTSGGQAQCDACRSDRECAPGFCDNRPGVGTGACTRACAPAAPISSNGCPATTPYGASPFCKQQWTGDFACRPCIASDCSRATPYCADGPGPHRGQCVGCRGDADCSPADPVCDLNSRLCRPRAPWDCAPGTLFNAATGTCVDCLTDGDCRARGAARCGAGGRCLECASDSDCQDSARPLCSAAGGTCVPCNRGEADADARCRAKADGSVCVTHQGARNSGRCGPCDPGRDVAGTERSLGCSDDLPRCAWVGDDAPRCHACDPNDRFVSCESGACQRAGSSFECVLEEED